jgi:hypothetical protein
MWSEQGHRASGRAGIEGQPLERRVGPLQLAPDRPQSEAEVPSIGRWDAGMLPSEDVYRELALAGAACSVRPPLNAYPP